MSQSGKQAMVTESAMNALETELLEFINSRLGLVVSANRGNDIRQLFKSAMEKFKLSPQDYLRDLKSANDEAPILKDLIVVITIGETYFFRDKKQMQLLQETVLPAIIAAKRKAGDFSLRIWSAGCASGEELYTIIMILNELLYDFDSWEVHFLGTDINTKLLHKAVSGVYSEWSMRSIPDYYKSKYLKLNGMIYSLNDDIKNSARFSYFNLNDHFPSIINGIIAQDLIICRNVLIYFDEIHIRQIMKKFGLSLATNGYLLLGASDPINVEDAELVLQPEYGKLFTRGIPAAKLNFESNKPVKAANVIPLPKKPLAPAASTTTVNLTQLADESRWQEMITIIDGFPLPKYNTASVLALKAAALANLGQLKEAVKICEQSIKLDSIRLQTYFTYAMILAEMNDFKNAETALRKTLFLDNDFVLGHYQLGLLLIKIKNITGGIKSLKNAHDIALRSIASKTVEGYDDLTYGKLAAILQDEIKIYDSIESEN